MNRGEIWWANLGVPFGSEPGYTHPVIIIQADTFNRSLIRTVVVVPMTANLKLAAAPGNVLCRPRETGLKKSSVANVSQLAVIDRRRLTGQAGTLSHRLLDAVADGCRLVLGL